MAACVRERVVPDWVRRLNHIPCRVSTEMTLMQMAYFMGLGPLQWNRNIGHWQPQSFFQVSRIGRRSKWFRETYLGCRMGKHAQIRETGIITNERTPNSLI